MAGVTALPKAVGQPAAGGLPIRFKLQPFADIGGEISSPYLVKGIIPREGLVVVWGAPKTGKSFWICDAPFHVALGWKYRGRHVKAGVVVFKRDRSGLRPERLRGTAPSRARRDVVGSSPAKIADQQCGQSIELPWW